jgi:hypothetical protein
MCTFQYEGSNTEYQHPNKKSRAISDPAKVAASEGAVNQEKMHAHPGIRLNGTQILLF